MSKRRGNVPSLQEKPVAARDGFRKSVSLFRLACKNIFTYFWMNAKMCLTFACLAFLICLFTVYNVALDQKKTAIERESSSANYFYAQYDSTVEKFKEACTNIAFEDQYFLHSFEKDIYRIYGVGGRYLADSTFFVMQVGGTQYRALDKLSFGCAAHTSDAFFTPRDYEELAQRFGRNNFFDAGGYPAAADEVAVGLPMLEAYGISPAKAVGQELTVCMKDPRPGQDPLPKVFQAKISGVICAEFYKLAGHRIDNTRPFFLFRSDNAFMAKSKFARTRCYLSAWPAEEEAETWQFEGGTTYAYVGYKYVNNINTIENIQILASNLYIIIGSALIIGLVLTIFLMIDKYMKVFSRSSGILMTFGMRRSRLFMLLGLQLFILCLIAVPIAFLLTTGGYLTITFLVKYLTAIELTVTKAWLFGILLLGIASVVAVSFFFFVYALFKFRFKTIKQYLTTVVD